MCFSRGEAPPDHPRRGEIVGTTAIALHVADNSEEAIAFADTALRKTLPPEQEAEVRLSIAGMFAISAEIRITAGRVALTLPGLPEVLRARHLACLVHNLVMAGRIEDARSERATTRDCGSCTCGAASTSACSMVEDSQADLKRAVDLFESGPRPLAFATALEDLGATVSGRMRPARRELGAALLAYRADASRRPVLYGSW